MDGFIFCNLIGDPKNLRGKFENKLDREKYRDQNAKEKLFLKLYQIKY